MIFGADNGSKLVVGPEQYREIPPVPMEHILDNAHEISGTGTLFPDETGNLLIHLHMACGRKSSTITGCIRKGVKVWNIMEVILFELLDSTAIRELDPQLGFKLLKIK